MRSRRLPVLVAVAVAVFVPVTSAGAQIPTPSPVVYAPDYATLINQTTFLRQAIHQPGRGTVERARGKRDRRGDRERRRDKRERRRGKRDRRDDRPTARQRAALRFEPDAGVTASVEQTFVEGFGAPGVPAETVLADLTHLRGTMVTDLQRVGWREDDLGDLAAYSLLVGYMMLNDEATVPVKGAAALRRAVRDELAATRSVRRLPDARQQEVAETLVLRVAYNIGEINDLAAEGDVAGASESRERLRDFVRSVFGVDVTGLRLAERGLVKRRD